MKALKAIGRVLGDSGSWKKLANPTVSFGQTAWPKGNADLERVGVRLDYHGEVTQDGTVYYRYQCQPNGGKIPPSLKDWRDSNGGTHAVITTVLIKKDGTRAEVLDVIERAMNDVTA